MDLLRNRAINQENIVVSIICNTFNHSKYIKDAIESFLNQNVDFDVEILIHDDCSTDGTIDIIDEYKQKYPTLIKPMYEIENQYSKGIDILAIQAGRIKGKYVAICEGDDFWIDQNKLSKQVSALEQSEAKMCVHKVKRIDGNSGNFLGFLPEPAIKSGIISSNDFLSLVTTQYSFQTSSYMLDAQEFKKMYCPILPFVKKMPTGDEAILLYFLSVGPVLFIDDTMSVYRSMNDGSWSSSYSKLSQKEIGFHKKRCHFAYKEFDKYTKKKFHSILSKRLFDTKWAYYYLTKRYISLFFFDPRGSLSLLKKHFKKS